jgi:hypothetical protein
VDEILRCGSVNSRLRFEENKTPGRLFVDVKWIELDEEKVPRFSQGSPKQLEMSNSVLLVKSSLMVRLVSGAVT